MEEVRRQAARGGFRIGELVAFAALVRLASVIGFAAYAMIKAVEGMTWLATTKRCGQCCERVKNAAARCRFCGSALGQ